jgi:threonine/homoserine/homoserine lactone efflux protein
MELLLLGAGLGLAAGVSPGPLLTLMVASTLERGLSAGLRIAIAPLLTDAPIILLCLLVLRELPDGLLRWITYAGAAFVAYLGFETLRSAGRTARQEGGGSRGARDLWRGAAVNFLNPHPWLFWTTVGGPTVITAWRRAPWRAVAFLAGFYLLIVGSKSVIAWIVARAGVRLRGAWYRRLLALCGLLLLALAALLAWRGLA